MHSVDEIDGVFKYLMVLIKESPSKLDTAKHLGVTKTIKVNNGEALITEEFLETQEKICKLIHLVELSDDPIKNVSNLMYVRKKYLNKILRISFILIYFDIENFIQIEISWLC